MKLIYDVNDKPTFGKIIVFAFQQMIAIMAATLLVPIIISSQGLTPQQHCSAQVSARLSTSSAPREEVPFSWEVPSPSSAQWVRQPRKTTAIGD